MLGPMPAAAAPPPSRLARHLAAGEEVLDQLRPEAKGLLTPATLLALSLVFVPVGAVVLLAGLGRYGQDGSAEGIVAAIVALAFLAAPLVARLLAWNEARFAATVLTTRQLLVLDPFGSRDRAILPQAIGRIEVQPTHGPYGTLRILPDDVAIGGLADPEAAARRIAAWAGERTALWRDWTLARLAEAAAGMPDEQALTVLRRPDLGLAVALPREWAVELAGPDGAWRRPPRALGDWHRLRALGIGGSRLELTVWDGGLAAGAAELRAALDTPPGGAIESGEVAIGPWRGVFARAAPASADPPRGIVLRPAGEVRAALRNARAPGRRAELREEILLDSGPRHIHLRLSGHADTAELFAVLQAAARALRPA